MKLNNRTNITEAELPRELADKVSPAVTKVIRREGNKIFCLKKRFPELESNTRLRKMVYDVASERVIEDQEWKETDLSLGERIAYTVMTVGFALPLVVGWWTRNKRDDYYKTQEWNRLERELQEKNEMEEMQHLTKLVATIRLYQGSIAEVEQDLSMRLKRIDTQTPNTFLKEFEVFDLRVKAAQLGADAVVHYRTQMEEDSCGCHEMMHLGTPVKFAGPLYRSQYDIIVEEASC